MGDDLAELSLLSRLGDEKFCELGSNERRQQALSGVSGRIHASKQTKACLRRPSIMFVQQRCNRIQALDRSHIYLIDQKPVSILDGSRNNSNRVGKGGSSVGIRHEIENSLDACIDCSPGFKRTRSFFLHGTKTDISNIVQDLGVLIGFVQFLKDIMN